MVSIPPPDDTKLKISDLAPGVRAALRLADGNSGMTTRSAPDSAVAHSAAVVPVKSLTV